MMSKTPTTTQEIQCAHCGGIPHEDVTSCKEVTKNESGGYIKELTSIMNRFLKGDTDIESELDAFIKEVQKEERERCVEIVEYFKKIDSEKWQDAAHCTCLGYAISMITNDDDYHPKDYKCNEIKND